MEASYHRHDISDELWALLETHLLGQRGQWGGIVRTTAVLSTRFSGCFEQERPGGIFYAYAVSVGMEPIIPSEKNRKKQREYDKYLYKLRHLIENAFLLLETDAFTAAQIRCIAIWAVLLA